MMKFFASLLPFVCLAWQGNDALVQGEEVVLRKLQTVAVKTIMPTQTFFVALPETSLFDDLFKVINSADTKAPVVTLLSVTISTDETVIWYDQWEDGYDLDVGVSTAKTTQIWGDGNATNGCAPTILNCTHSLDRLMAGDSIVIQNNVAIPRVKTSFLYDGGDRIQSSYPVAVVRAAYASSPGSVLAGAIEVLDTTQWGKTFEAPVGVDLGKSLPAFEHSIFMIMAGSNNTKVTFPNNTVTVLNIGQSTFVKVNQGNQVRSDKPIQVHLLTGDINSQYETRWYSMRPIENYYKSYVTPVGDSMGKTKMVVYNPSNATITVKMQYLVNNTVRTSTGTIAKKQMALTPVIPFNSGAWIDSNSTFVALTITDSEFTDGENYTTGGQMYDWGCPVVPREELTPEVLLGLGYGCTNNKCGTETARSVAWVSPVEDADVYVDFENKGWNTTMFSVKAMASIRVRDPKDKDMSGASIFAVKAGTGIDGPPVDIAVAWGQDPSVSKPNQPISMDMGTVTLPFTNVKVAKIVDKNLVNPGDDLLYTIRVSNVGQKNTNANELTVKDTLDIDVTYVPGSTVMSYLFGDMQVLAIPDSTSGTPFPLDEEGFTIPTAIPRRGSIVDIAFKVKIATSLTGNKSKIVNTGVLSRVGGSDLPYETTSFVSFNANVKVTNTVLLGTDGSKCALEGQELVAGKFGSDVTYCFTVTNTGTSHLINIKLTNAQLGSYVNSITTKLAPGQSTSVFTNQKLLAAGTNDVVVIASPAFANGAEISDLAAVTATDPSAVTIVQFNSKIAIVNTVYLGSGDRGAKCGTSAALESVSDIFGSPVTYCFDVTNTGDSWLNGLSIVNNALNYTLNIPGSLAPGAKTSVYLDSKISQDLDNMAVVTGQPILADGTKIVGSIPVTSQDPSAVKKLTFLPSINIENTVYLGKDGGIKCGSTEAVEFVADFYSKPATYCFKITNSGETSLKDVSITNGDLSYINKSIGTLASGASVVLHLEKTILSSLKNTAVVVGTPVTADGRALLDLNNVEASDPSEVGLKDNKPSISVENTVVLGHDGGCGTDLAKESVEGYPGSKVTYCFNVKNTGDSYLDSITLVNDKLAYTTPVAMLAPGVSTMVTLEKTITGTFQNLVKVTANPTLETGVDIPNQADVTASDTSAIVQLAYTPSIGIANTVYLGSKEAQSCLSSVEFVQGYFGSDVTYCFNVTNTGNTYLKGIKIENAELGIKDSESIKALAPGESVLIAVGGKISKPMENVAWVSGTPVKESGESLALPDVKNSDPSSVGRIAHKPSIMIDNKVYKGTTDNKLCGTDKAMELVKDIYMTDVVYCLKVTNTGDTHLSSIVVDDDNLEFNQKLQFPLAPGASELIMVPGKIVNDLKNVATVTANPTLQDGTDIEGQSDVTGSDDSAVSKLVFVPSVKVDNTVYKGVDGGKSCQSSTESVKDLFGTDVTYCFKVTNTGTTSLKNVVLSNMELVYAETLTKPLAPGESTLLTLPGKIAAELKNEVVVTATPVMADGRALLDLADVTARDPSGVELLPHKPSITIANTVYIGADNGANCATAVEVVQDDYGTAVTYCFTVKNTGDTFLEDVTLSNIDIKLVDTNLGMLAPGESKTFPVLGEITGDLTNNAVVKGSPSLKDGANIPGAPDVTATDPSSVKVIVRKPSINIENTVYLGADGGAGCANSKLESVTGYPKTDVVYCLEVLNTGDSYLSNVVIVDTEIALNDNSIKLLAPGESKIIPVFGAISGNLTNTAKVTATPALEDGKPLPNSTPVQDSDTSGVVLQPYSPAITIDNVVATGKDTDACSRARNLAEGFNGDDITYCFIVTNKGDTVLSDILIVDNALAYSSTPIKPLAPGESITVTLPSTITGDLVNVAVVTGTPVNKDLTPISGLGRVTHEDPSEINQFDVVGAVKIDNVVFINGDDASCSSATDFVEGTYGTPVTYCLTVTNTGETHLSNVVVKDTELNYSSSPIKTLAPGESILLPVPSKIVSSQGNTAIVTANPVTSAGKDIPNLKDVTSQDASKVIKVDSKAGIAISNTVYPGTDDGKSCGTTAAVELVGGYYGSPVTYCLEVKNTGESHLSKITIVDKELSYSDTITPLAPGESKIISLPGKIIETLTNTAIVTGTPSLKDGTVIPGMEPVKATDPSGVTRTKHIPSVDIVNTVYLGGSTNSNGMSSCGTDIAVEHVEHYAGAVVTYCFEVTNKGDTHLNNVVIVDEELSFEDKIPKTLAPGESITVSYTSTIEKPLKNNAVVTANPVLIDGTDIPDLVDVTWSDTSSVGELVYNPSITINNTVYIGDDNGLACGTDGVEVVSGKNGTLVTYCFTITNTGDTYLSDIKFKDIELAYEDSSILILPPLTSKTLAFPSSITGNLTNHAVVTANPTLADGADISGAQDVSATDPSEVIIKKGIDGDVKQGDKDPYSPPTNNTACIQNNWKAANHSDDLVCASKEVYIDTLKSKIPKSCKAGDSIVLTVDASIQIAGPRNDVGWYVAADGGDALTGTCIVNGFQNNGATYNITNTASTSAGFIQWTLADGADGDQCGDVFIVNDGSAKLDIPILVDASMPCVDDNDDGLLDFAICFTWKTDATNGVCSISTNIPGTNCGCFCTRVDIPNVEVDPPPSDPIAPC